MASMVSTETAHAFLKSHYLETFESDDGIVARGEAYFMRGYDEAHEDGDAWFEELTAFPIAGGMVDISAIKAFLGY